jgi:hypothetical protein
VRTVVAVDDLACSAFLLIGSGNGINKAAVPAACPNMPSQKYLWLAQKIPQKCQKRFGFIYNSDISSGQA